MKKPVIAIFDVGKTNKKLFLFDENYKVVYEKTARFIETTDEDGDPCENLDSLRLSVFDSMRQVFKLSDFDIKIVNFATYGASMVYIDEYGNPLTALYNYLKDYPKHLKDKFYSDHGGEKEFSRITASPVLGSLNSGMQVYRLMHEKPMLFQKLRYALHLPHYLSYLITGEAYSEITSIGCHTNLWDFTTNRYHKWVQNEGILEKLAPIIPSDAVMPPAFPGNTYKVGVGLHDSSAALIPYLINFKEPFVLISTGTWCISLNPFNPNPPTAVELEKDCLCYMQYKGKPVKASRLFAGYEHEQQVKRIAAHFNQDSVKYRNIKFDNELVEGLETEKIQKKLFISGKNKPQQSVFTQRDLSSFRSDREAYHQLMLDLVAQQFESTNLVIQNTKVKRIFVDGGFSKNQVYMNLLARIYPDMEIYAASMAQATAIGTALANHYHWNTLPPPNNIIELKYYSATRHLMI